MKKFLLFPLLRYPTLIGLEKKLKTLSKQGKNIDAMGAQNTLFLTLFPTSSKDFHYAVDYNKHALPSYRGEWESRGWELCARFSGYFIWRIADQGKEPRMPERTLLSARRQKLAKSFRACALIFLVAALILAFGMYLIIRSGHADKCLSLLLEIVAILLVVAYFAWSSGKMKAETN